MSQVHDLRATREAHRRSYMAAWRPTRTIPNKMAEVAAHVAYKHGLTVADLRGSARTRHIAWARQEAFAMCNALKRRGKRALSLPAIGKYFGERDHTTVLYGIRAHEARQAGAE